MLWAIASSIFVIYLYRKLNAAGASPADNVPTDSVEAEIAALNAHIATLESKIAGASSGGIKP